MTKELTKFSIKIKIKVNLPHLGLHINLHIPMEAHIIGGPPVIINKLITLVFPIG